MEFLTTFSNILLIILGFGLLIFIHELGHFVAAKWAGIRTEAFAVGMGPVAVAWRKGIGLRFGSTAAEYERNVRRHLDSQPPHEIKLDTGKTASGTLPQAELYRIGDKIGLGETEYSLRWLPLGGFVKMLGQEDANPNYVSNDPRSYTRCPVGKRMIVVSAGVIMNIILAMILFIIAFMVGVKFEAPVVGEVAPNMPAAQTIADKAALLGITNLGLQPGDEVISIDGKEARTFADLQIATAMSRPGEPVRLTVQRRGVAEPLSFTIKPQKDEVTGLLGIGVYPGASTTIIDKDEASIVNRYLQRSGATRAGIDLGMTLLSVNGQRVSTYGELKQAVRASNGQALETTWARLDATGERVGQAIVFNLPVKPEYMEYRQRESSTDAGLLGLTPLARIAHVEQGSPNHGLLQPGDIILKVADVSFPRASQMIEAVQTSESDHIPIKLRRGNQEIVVEAERTPSKQLLVQLEPASDVMITAQPLNVHYRYNVDGSRTIEEIETPIKSANLLSVGGSHLEAVDGVAIANWPEFRAALIQSTAKAFESKQAAQVRLTFTHPVKGHEQETAVVELSDSEVRELHELAWTIDLPSGIFESIQTTLSADGSPLKAIAMGFGETKKLVLMTYLTIDRLIRGSVGVDQLRGPVGIIHIGSKVADRGLMYIIFFLGMISVNLAVINFLPMPIVDGGLFLFLVYEKFKGRPPSIAFQNAATVAGLCVIGALFLVTFYNDVLRLVS